MINPVTKTVIDFKIYLTEIERLSRKLEAHQQVELNSIISNMLTLLVSLRRDSGLGEISDKII